MSGGSRRGSHASVNDRDAELAASEAYAREKVAGAKSFEIESEVIPVGGMNARYPYGGTENWKKAIGAHLISIEATVDVDDAAADVVT